MTRMESMDETVSIRRNSEPETITRDRYVISKIKDNVEYYYVDANHVGIVWRNVAVFVALHLIYFYGVYVVVKLQNPWVLILINSYGTFGGLGVTAGAHRLWSHRSYKARFPLRLFLMIGDCVAIQNDVIEWSRDHRLHHKRSDTDADPHNSSRGWFFAHMGWLMLKKHPKVLEVGRKIDVSDLQRDPVLAFQKRHYWLLSSLIGFILPSFALYWLFGLTYWEALCVNIARYITGLHSTWTVNSAAHVWGEQVYDERIEPRESKLVSYYALGEGFHNYHHTFPFDYSTSEFGGYINLTTIFINSMKFMGLAYSLRKANPDTVKKRRQRTGQHSLAPTNEVGKFL